MIAHSIVFIFEVCNAGYLFYANSINSYYTLHNTVYILVGDDSFSYSLYDSII